MKRKLIKQGIGGVTISLPISWVRENNLEPGDELDVIENENNLILQNEQIKNKQHYIKIDFSKFSAKTIYRLLTNIYTEGFTDVKIKYSNITTTALDNKGKINVSDFINTIIDEYIGFEIIDQNDNFTHIQQVSIIDEDESDMTIRRIFFLNSSILEKIKESLRGKTITKNSIKRDIFHMWKFLYYRMRLIKLRVVKGNKVNHYSMMDHFEIMANNYNIMINYLGKDEFSNKLLEMTKEVQRLNKIAQDYYYKFSYIRYNEFDLELRKFYAKVEKQIKHLDDKEIEFKRLLTNCVISIHNIVKIRISMELRNTK